MINSGICFKFLSLKLIKGRKGIFVLFFEHFQPKNSLNWILNEINGIVIVQDGTGSHYVLSTRRDRNCLRRKSSAIIYIKETGKQKKLHIFSISFFFRLTK